MNILEIEQGTPEWIMARIGIPTASAFHRIMTPADGKYSKAADDYICELLAERMLNASLDDSWTSAYAERGTGMEAEARTWYELTRDVDVREVGFVLRDDGQVGCSPDGLVEPDGGIEIKCLGAKRHVEMVAGGFPAKMTQVQGGLWLAEREWWDVVAYNPGLPKAVTRVWRDDKYIKKLAGHVDRFLGELAKAEAQMHAAGGSVYREIKPKASKPALVEPDPNFFQPEDIEKLRADLDAAEDAGLIQRHHTAEILGFAAGDRYMEARMLWTSIKGALADPEKEAGILAVLGLSS